MPSRCLGVLVRGDESGVARCAAREKKHMRCGQFVMSLTSLNELCCASSASPMTASAVFHTNVEKVLTS